MYRRIGDLTVGFTVHIGYEIVSPASPATRVDPPDRPEVDVSSVQLESAWLEPERADPAETFESHYRAPKRRPAAEEFIDHALAIVAAAAWDFEKMVTDKL